MPYSQYRYKFYFNASHAIYFSGEIGQSHPHTWEVILNCLKVTDNFVLFDEVEKMCEDFLSNYQDVFINTIPPFTTMNPTLENLCLYFKDKLQEKLHEKGWLLLSIELSETPSRSYIISTTDDLEFGKAYFDKGTEETLQEIVDKMTSKKVGAMVNAKKTSQAEESQIEKELKHISDRMTKPNERLWRKLTGKKVFK